MRPRDRTLAHTSRHRMHWHHCAAFCPFCPSAFTPGPPLPPQVTISYAGPEGYTNQRFMAQYGFVPVGGNAADRVKLELTPE